MKHCNCNVISSLKLEAHLALDLVTWLQLNPSKQMALISLKNMSCNKARQCPNPSPMNSKDGSKVTSKWGKADEFSIWFASVSQEDRENPPTVSSRQ
eukprot:282992-Amphidinium_carterae.1